MRLFWGVVLSSFVSAAVLTGCMDAGDRGLGPACEAKLAAAERDLKAAEARGLHGKIAWTQAASLIAVARTQQQFSEYQNCVLKANRARYILLESK
jgi:hypothetical protein